VAALVIHIRMGILLVARRSCQCTLSTHALTDINRFISLTLSSNMTCWLCGSETTNLFTNIESPTCKNGPCKVCIAVKRVDEEINQASAALRRLLAKRCDLRSEQNRVHGSLMHRLPIELKNYIFQLLSPLRDNWGRIEAPGVIMPLYLTLVCTGWRDIALSNPFLWSTIHVRIGGQVSRPSDIINFVREWILRSRTMPLTFHLDVQTDDYDEEELKGIIGAISQSSNRCHSLSLEIPSKVLRSFSIQCPPLKRLRITLKRGFIREPVPFLNSEGLEEIETRFVSYQSLQISWNHLSSAKVGCLFLEDIVHLLQHAPQMTYCHISELVFCSSTFTMPSITHQRLKTLILCGGHSAFEDILRSLTLPCLQEFGTDQLAVIPIFLPALVERSSCPLVRIILFTIYETEFLNDFHSLPGVTDLFLESSIVEHVPLEKLLLDEYLPNLSRLTLRLEPFLHLWKAGTISKLLVRKWPWAGGGNEGRHRKILVIDPIEAGKFSGSVWETDIGECLKDMQWNIRLRRDGFELMVPEV